MGKAKEYQIGYCDGLHGNAMRWRYLLDLQYRNGYNAGMRASVKLGFK